MSNKEIRMYLIALLVTFVIVSVLYILSNIYLDEERKLPEEVKEQIVISEWPVDEVPIFYRENLEIYKYGDGEEMIVQEIKKGVSFEEYRDYLIELAEAGFVADIVFGCEDPRNISKYADTSELMEFAWFGTKGDMQVQAFWKREDSEDLFIDNMYVILTEVIE